MTDTLPFPLSALLLALNSACSDGMYPQPVSHSLRQGELLLLHFWQNLQHRFLNVLYLFYCIFFVPVHKTLGLVSKQWVNVFHRDFLFFNKQSNFLK